MPDSKNLSSFSGDKDSVTCFYCECKSGNWRSGEDPWKRHARTSPHCQYLVSAKGADFVSDTLQVDGEYQPPIAGAVTEVRLITCFL